MNAIELINVKKSFRDFDLDTISFVVPTGTIMGLIGENGAGKTTIFQLIMDAIDADSGSITVLGTNNTSNTFALAKQDVAFVVDNFSHLELSNNAYTINIIMKNTYKNWDTKQYFSYLTQFDLPQKKKISSFSLGMQKKLAIAIALSHGAKLLVLDEPTNGLDPVARDEILCILNEFTRDENHSILISSHTTSDLEKICDYITFIHKGTLLLCEEKDKLLEGYARLKIEEADLGAIPENAIVKKKKTAFGFELLVKTNQIENELQTEKVTLEDIMLFMVKKEEKRA